jgi:glutamine amidotransferase
MGTADSEVLFALALDRLDAGASLGDALVDVIGRVEAASGGRLNLMLSDGELLAATACGDTLFVRTPFDHQGAIGTVLASEPYDDGPGWQPVADRTLVLVDGSGPTLRPFDPPAA